MAWLATDSAAGADLSRRLHDIDEPRLWHGNTLTGAEICSGLFAGAPALYDVVLTNPPFGGTEGEEAQTRFAYKTRATQVLFLQHVIDSLKPGGRCGIVMDEGVLLSCRIAVTFGVR